jgi:hypothetical protein
MVLYTTVFCLRVKVKNGLCSSQHNEIDQGDYT